MQLKGVHEKSISTGDYQAWLCFGPDRGRVSDLAVRLQRRYAAAGLDAEVFESTEIARDPAILMDRLGGAGLFSKGSVLRIREADDKIAKAIDSALLAGFPDGRLILEAGELTGASKLKKLFEAHDQAAALPCWQPTEQELGARARLAFQELKAPIKSDAIQLLARLSPPDTGALITECQKLAIYADGAEITVAHVEAASADHSEAGFSDAAHALVEGRPGAAMSAYWRMIHAGETGIGILRILQRHVQRLHEARVQMEAGKNADTAMAALRPPIFWKEKDAFKRQLGLWTSKPLEQLMARLIEAERAAKSGTIETATIGQTILTAALDAAKTRAK